MFKNILSLLVVLLIAFALRFYQLGETPKGMAWDEAAIGYNGYAIFTTRRDEWLQKLPISFRSFGDYKAPLAIYQSGIFTALFGLNLFAVRLPFALHGVLAVYGFYLLIREIFSRDQHKEKWALLSSLILALSPWHIHYSRLAFESGLALNLLIWALFFFYRYLRSSKLIHLLFSVILSVLTIYAYHSSKVTTPLLFIFLLLTYWPILKKNKSHLITAAFIAFTSLLPFAQDAIYGEGLTRASSTIFSNDLNLVQICLTLVNNLFSYLSLDFLIFGENLGNFRHGDGYFGVIEPISVLLMICYFFWRKKNKTLFTVSLALILFGLLPAIISEGHSSSNRSLLALPGFVLLAALGFRAIWLSLSNHRKIFTILIISAYFGLTVLYQQNYYSNYPLRSSDDFVDGYIEAFNFLKETDRSQIDQIVFTSDYQHPYVYALFAFEVNPIAYQGGILNTFFFANQINQFDLAKPKSIVVASKFDQMGDRLPDKIINGSDGQGRFFIYLPL